MRQERNRQPTTITLSKEERELLEKLGELMKRSNRSDTVRALLYEKWAELQQHAVV